VGVPLLDLRREVDHLLSELLAASERVLRSGSYILGQEVRLFEDQYVTPSLALSVASMLLELGERKLTGVWNTAGADMVNRVEFGQAVCDLFGFNRRLLIPVKMADAKLPSPRPSRSALKPDKARAQLASRPLGLADALALFHREYQSEPPR